jgi:AAA domain-containing protein
MSKRVRTRDEIETDVLEKSGRRCCICYGLHNDLTVKQEGQIAHIDGHPENSTFDNLAFLCLRHHVRLDMKSNRAKGYKISEVKRYRDRLYTVVARMREQGEESAEEPPSEENTSHAQPLGSQARAELAWLEVPTGVVPLASPFYVERDADGHLYQQLERSGTITTIRGARQTGKTSLLVRGVDYARKREARVIYLDFQEVFGPSQLDSIDHFLKSLADAISDQAEVDLANVDSIWQSRLSPKAKMTRFVETTVLGITEDPVVLLLDEADVLLTKPFYNEFFGLIRSWHNKRAFDDRWGKLSMVLSISTHPSLLIDDISQSPFNVGLTIQLRDFSELQVRDLNARHGVPVKKDEIPAVMALLGGQPYLVRQALYILVERNISWHKLDEIAHLQDGPFAGHLRYYLELLYSDEELMNAMRKVVMEKTCSAGRSLLQLRSAGLVRREGQKRVCRYGLYEAFFRSQL